MAERVYIETTVVSYLTARPNRDVVIAGCQQVTHGVKAPIICTPEELLEAKP